MTWYNFSKVGTATTPQADNAETCTVLETGEAGITLPFDVRIVDIVLAATATNNHEFQFYVNGHAVGSQFFSGQINPATQGRLNWANQNIGIGKGSRIQIKTAQKSGASAEAATVLVQFVP